MVTKADIALVRSLAKKKSREEHGLFVVEGRKMVAEALESGMGIHRIFATEEFAGTERCEVVSRKDIERMSSLKTPQGILALVELPEFGMPVSPGSELTLAIDGVQDPGNLGTIIRVADWFGIRDVVCSTDTANVYAPKVVQATMGAIFRVRVHYADLPAALGNAGRSGTPIYGTFLEGDNMYDSGFDGGKGIIVLGSEGSGISPAVAAAVTEKLYIPPYPAGGDTSESLNVGVAAAIVCAEFRRRFSR